jgi:hypothetical protein
MIRQISIFPKFELLLLNTSFVYLFFLTISSFVQADIPRVVSYQGKVSDTAGDPVADGSYDIQFKIFNAVTGGTERWDSGLQSIDINCGIFNVHLGENPQPILDLAFDEDYWLEVTVESDVQTPRTKLGSVGYAHMASGLVAGTVVEGDVDCAITGITTKTSGVCYGGYLESESSEGTGLRAWATATNGVTHGVYGRSYSTSNESRGVYGRFMATTGITYGVYGVSNSGQGVGVRGDAPSVGVRGTANAAAGATYGGHFTSSAVEGRGVYGECSSSTGTNYGIYRLSHSDAGIGVLGWANASSGQTCGGRFFCNSSDGTGVWGRGHLYGIHGYCTSSNGRAVYGEATSNSGTNYAGYFETGSTSGRACYGWATATSGETYGGVFKTDSPDGYGVWARASATTGESTAGYFETSSSDGRGVIGIAPATSGSAWGIYGRSSSSEGYGVAGAAWATSGEAYGGSFYTNSTEGAGIWAQGPQRGIHAKATGTSGNNYAAYGETNSSDGYAGYFDGRMKVTAPFCGRPAYDSGWIAISSGSTANLTHNLGGNTDNYVVVLQMRESLYELPHNGGLGGDRAYPDNSFHYTGVSWDDLDTNEISIYRGSSDISADEIRIRI